MDRDLSPDLSASDGITETAAPVAPASSVVVSVCITCKAADGAIIGPDMLAAVQAAIDEANGDVVVRPVQCLSVCKRPATVAVTSSDGYTFLFGDLETESGSAAIASFVKSYKASNYGLVPWRERAQVLRKGMIARVPPLVWSPDDGRPPT
jgi:predicted metal-binding protein